MAFPHKPSKSPAAVVPIVPQSKPALPALPRLPAEPWTDVDVATSHGRVSVRLGHGTGMPLLFLHGNSADKDVFVVQMAGRLWENCRMVALDLPGHGASQDAPDPERSYTIAGYADLVVEVLDALDLAEAALVGWSLGGHVAIEVAARHPGILGLMLCGTPPIGRGRDATLAGFVPSPELMLAGQAALTPAEIDAFVRLTHGVSEPRARAAAARTDGRARALMVADLIRGAGADERTFVESAALPIAVVNGDDDPLVDVAYLQGLRAAGLWYRRIHLIRGGGHAPFKTRPAAFDALLSRFIRSMGRRHRAATASPALWLAG